MQDTPELRPADGEPTLAEEAGAVQPDASPADGPVSPEVMPGMEQLLRKAELAAQEHHDAWLRAKAEADNIRKRAQVEVANAHKFALENFATELLPVKDSLEAALVAETPSVDSLRNGVELTLKQLKSVFDKFNLTEINPVAQKFDPHRHQAISAVESDAEPNTVLQVLQKGYLLHDRVVRPALVTVAKAKTVES
jgi:molecular chaperone GrpE